jgi:hypothetical protein
MRDRALGFAQYAPLGVSSATLAALEEECLTTIGWYLNCTPEAYECSKAAMNGPFPSMDDLVDLISQKEVEKTG